MMGEESPELVSRAQVARYAQVSRAAVTAWQRRNSDFPEPVHPDAGLFDLRRIVEWLSSRVIPADARQPHESVDATYADRIRARTGTDVPGTPARVPREGDDANRAFFRIMDDLRGTLPVQDSALLVAVLAFVRGADPDSWNSLRDRTARGAASATDLTAVIPSGLLGFLQDLRGDVFARAVRGVDRIDTQDLGRKLLLDIFARALDLMEGDRTSVRAGLRTPSSVVRTMVELLGPVDHLNRVYDPFCRTGELLAEAVRTGRGRESYPPPRVGGTAFDDRDFHLSSMNLALHDVAAELDTGLPWGTGKTPDTADLVLMNPPFNMRSPSERDPSVESFRYGEPPKGNANFRWLQLVVDRLSPNGRASVLMANGASLSTNTKEAAIRKNMVEDGVVECLIALPDHLFADTTIPVTLWLMRAPLGACEEILFIDASGLGTMASRTSRVLHEQDTGLIRHTLESWRAGRGTDPDGEGSGIGRAATVQEIRDRNYLLRPSIYVPGRVAQANPTQQDDTIDALLRKLVSLETRLPEVDERADQFLREVGPWTP